MKLSQLSQSNRCTNGLLDELLTSKWTCEYMYRFFTHYQHSVFTVKQTILEAIHKLVFLITVYWYDKFYHPSLTSLKFFPLKRGHPARASSRCAAASHAIYTCRAAYCDQSVPLRPTSTTSVAKFLITSVDCNMNSSIVWCHCRPIPCPPPPPSLMSSSTSSTALSWLLPPSAVGGSRRL